MEVSDEAEELLETLWINTKEKELNTDLKNLKKLKGDAPLQELSKLSLITVSNSRVKLTDRGLKEAESVVRRQRLAERLLVDVLDVKGKLVEETACKFEHLLHKGIDESICTLLGHPKFCPHGSPIPPGECCLDYKETAKKIVSPLSDLNPGQEGKIVYLHTRIQKRIQRLVAMGVLPGKPVSLIQRFPSYVFQIGQTKIATDEDTARDIYVRLIRR